VLRIRHERLGDVLALENRGLDYCLVLESGVRIEVNAEEQPGEAYNLPDNYAFVADVTDWTLAVTLRRVDGSVEAGADQRAGQEG
jgi:hypothetical protein